MYIYFCSDYPAVVKLDGNVYKKIYNEPTLISSITKDTFIELCPLKENEKHLSFFIDEAFWQDEKEGIIITDLKGGYLISFKSTPLGESLNVIFQHKTEHYALSVFSDKGKKLSIETHNDFYFENIEFDFDEVKVVFFERGALGVWFNSKEPTLIVYSLDNNITKIFQKHVSYYNYSNTLVIKQKYIDVAKHEVTSEWDFSNKKAIQVNKNITRSQDFHPGLLSESVMPYAFLEELLIGGDVENYLHDKLKSSKDKLKGYLGDFIGVCPPPPFRECNEIGLIFAIGKNRYEVSYLTVQLDNGKIINLKLAK